MPELTFDVSLKLTSNEPQVAFVVNPAIGKGFIFIVCVTEAEHPKLEVAVNITEYAATLPYK